MTETSKIIDGLKEAIAGDFPAVTIDGVRWVRESALLAAERRGIERAEAICRSEADRRYTVADQFVEAGRMRDAAHELAAANAAEAMANAILALAPEGDGWLPINVIFDGPPGHESGRFVEVETDEGKSIRVGEWIMRPDGLWALRIAAVRLPSPPKATE